jgi:hypothetical protein
LLDFLIYTEETQTAMAPWKGQSAFVVWQKKVRPIQTHANLSETNHTWPKIQTALVGVRGLMLE